MMERKIFAGPRMRRLRQSLDLTQAAMAKDLGISASYLNLVERNQRPLTAQLVLKLAETFSLDLRELSANSEGKLAVEMTEALADPVFTGKTPSAAEIMEVTSSAPAMAQAFLALYQAYMRLARGNAIVDRRPAASDRAMAANEERFPIEEVRDYFHSKSNFIAELDDAAEALNSRLKERDDLFASLRMHLRNAHGIRVSVVPLTTMPDDMRRFDQHGKRLFLSELLPVPSRIFQMAVQIALEEQTQLLDQLIAEAPLRTDDAKKLCRIGLANYFAGALIMPYRAFLKAAKALRYDISLLSARFGASIEQVTHRLTTLQRQGERGVPFFLLRLDNAGNVSKRFAAGGFHFARFGGTCPRWRVHDAFASPGQTIVQPVELPDGTVYLTMSRTVDAPWTPSAEPPRKLAISLGCEIAYADQVVYGDGLNLESPSAITPIGVTCRICERHNCAARAFPPMTRPLVINTNSKSRSAFEFG